MKTLPNKLSKYGQWRAGMVIDSENIVNQHTEAETACQKLGGGARCS